MTVKTKPAPAPGVYPGVPFDEYRSWDAASQSMLKPGRKSMAHLRHAQKFPPDATAAMRLGSFLHSFCLEPETLLSRYVVAPGVDRRTKAGKER